MAAGKVSAGGASCGSLPRARQPPASTQCPQHLCKMLTLPGEPHRDPFPILTSPTHRHAVLASHRRHLCHRSAVSWGPPCPSQGCKPVPAQPVRAGRRHSRGRCQAAAACWAGGGHGRRPLQPQLPIAAQPRAAPRPFLAALPPSAFLCSLAPLPRLYSTEVTGFAGVPTLPSPRRRPAAGPGEGGCRRSGIVARAGLSRERRRGAFPALSVASLSGQRQGQAAEPRLGQRDALHDVQREPAQRGQPAPPRVGAATGPPAGGRAGAAAAAGRAGGSAGEDAGGVPADARALPGRRHCPHHWHEVQVRQRASACRGGEGRARPAQDAGTEQGMVISAGFAPRRGKAQLSPISLWCAEVGKSRSPRQERRSRAARAGEAAAGQRRCLLLAR